jgi:hypothetical protein
MAIDIAKVNRQLPSGRLFRDHSRKVSSHHVGFWKRSFGEWTFSRHTVKENVGDRGLLNGSQQRRGNASEV